MSKFQQMENKLSGQGVRNLGAVAAKIGDAKYGKAVMHKAAAKGVSAASVSRKSNPGHAGTSGSAGKGHSKFFPQTIGA